MTNKRFRLSPAGGSGVSVLDVHACVRKIKLKWDGWSLKKTPFYFVYGDKIHQTAFLPYTHQDKSHDMPEIASKIINDVCASEIIHVKKQDGTMEQVDVEVTEKDAVNGPRMARAHMEVWQDKMYSPEVVEDVEKRVVSDFRDPATGQTLPEFEEVGISGRMDLLIDGKIKKIVDLKTTSSKLTFEQFSEFGYFLQLGTYRYLAAYDLGYEADVAIFQLVKNLTRKGIEPHAREVSPATPMRYDDVFRVYTTAARKLLACVKSGKWDQEYACQRKFNNCIFMPLCFSKQFDNPKKEIFKTLKNPNYQEM